MKKTTLFLTTLTTLVSLTPLVNAEGISNLKIMAPASPGGGWDQTSRAIQGVMQDTGIAKPVQVFNVPGAGGTIGLAQTVNNKGDGSQLMTMGLVMVGAIATNNSKVDLSKVTPIARLTGEYEVMVVPASSPYKYMKDFAAAWKTNNALPIAGGSAGGTDHILVGMLAKNIGIDTRKMNYVPFSGGGEALAAVLGNQVAAAVAGYSEFEAQVKAGKLRIIGVSAPTRLDNVDGPTFKEQGFRVELANWRGVVAPPGLSAEDKDKLVQAMDKVHSTKEWQEALKTHNWNDLYLSGPKYAVFLKVEAARVKNLLQELGIVK